MNSGNKTPEFYRLHYWEEASGILFDLKQDDDAILAHIGKVFLALPKGMEEEMRSYIGHKISALRTDESHRPYLLRELKSDITDEKK